LGKWSLGGEPHHPVAPFMRRELKTKDEKWKVAGAKVSDIDVCAVELFFKSDSGSTASRFIGFSIVVAM
jgi:hypothetical protein